MAPILRTRSGLTCVLWWTNIPTTSQVRYGVGDLRQVNVPVSTLRHIMLIGGLTAGTTYSYQVVSGGVAALRQPSERPHRELHFPCHGGRFRWRSNDENRVANNIAAGGTEFVQSLGG